MIHTKKLFLVTFQKSSFFLLLFLVLFGASCKTKQQSTNSSSKKDSGKTLSDKDVVQFQYVFYNANKERILGNYDLAETLFSQALKIDPNSAASMYEFANIYSCQNKKNKALFYSKKAAEIDPKNVW
ncbi:hypothetical protein BH10BAC1_BH10BAC1_00180 [soil metagenome]